MSPLKSVIVASGSEINIILSGYEKVLCFLQETSWVPPHWVMALLLLELKTELKLVSSPLHGVGIELTSLVR